MVTALLLAAICTLICAMMGSWNAILVMRALVGVALSGVAAVAMTYLSEEMDPRLSPSPWDCISAAARSAA